MVILQWKYQIFGWITSGSDFIVQHWRVLIFANAQMCTELYVFSCRSKLKI
uniref:Uncharacterized protein n=1 Tax=Rhizophora mucronata TaxID=61149 RepID=A0A2P2NZC2_RHIMU